MFASRRSRLKSLGPDEAVWQGMGDDVVAVHGPDGRFLKLSKGAEALFGKAPDLMTGKRLMDVVAPEYQRELLRAMAEVAAPDGKGQARFEFRVRSRKGTGKALEMVLSRTAMGFRSVTRNIEHRLMREQAIREEGREQIDLANRRSDQLANFSHELRTPLNAVIGFAGAIHGEQFGPLPNDRYRDYARIIHESGEHLLSLISDILDLNKAEANQTSLQQSAEDMPALIGFCTELLRLRIEEAGLYLHVDVDQDIGTVLIDAKIVRQIVLNLLSNALKFTGEGGISVAAALRGDMIEIIVKDTGVGMSPDDLSRVGTRFHQARKEGVRGAKGSGIGLSLSKALARVHGGELQLSSEAGRGTTAVLRIPYKPISSRQGADDHMVDNVVPLTAARG